jgi:carbon-monoxide dehydrogenase iron sulfur subunit
MSGALYKDEKGATLHDKDKCVGCWMCIMVCPFGAIERRISERIAIKCDLCPDREELACVSACPTGALFAGTITEFQKKVKKRSSSHDSQSGQIPSLQVYYA